MAEPSALDLTSVELVKQHLPGVSNQQGTADDDEIQILVTDASQYVHDYCGRSSSPSSLNSNNEYTEVRSGNGSLRLYTKDAPVTALVSVKVDGVAIPLSTGYNVPGAAIDTNQDAIVILPGTLGTFTVPFAGWFGPLNFRPGLLNVQLIYNAGFSSVPLDLQAAVTNLVGQNYMRRQHIDQANKAVVAAGGNVVTRYRDWWVDPYIERVLWKYRRVAQLT